MQSTYLDFERPLEELDRRIEERRTRAASPDEIVGLETSRDALERDLYADLSAWYRVLLSRHPDRPQTLDYASSVFREFLELHGDRAFADDAAIVGGFAWLGDERVMLVGHQRGRTTSEKIRRNFGMSKPEGYRKALRLFRLAERFGRPVVCMIDTQGAFPGPERRGARAGSRQSRETSSKWRRSRVPIGRLR